MNSDGQFWFYVKLLQYVGIVTISGIIIRLLYGIIWSLYVFNSKPIDFKKYGKWGVVTGCTDGIGKAYVENLAEKGLNIVLISRSLERLTELSEYLKSKYQVETMIIAADFSHDHIYKDIKENIENLDISILVNNVGAAYKIEYFHLIPDLDPLIDNLIQVNVKSAAKMTSIVLPGMIEKNRGIIVYVGSASGKFSPGLLSFYAATKSFMLIFSQALQTEYQDKNIIFQSQIPFYVSTKMCRQKKSFFVPTPEEYVDSVIRTIGKEAVTFGTIPHALMGFLCSYVYTKNHVFQKYLRVKRIADEKKKWKKISSQEKFDAFSQ